MGHLKAVVYVRPTQATFELLCQLLRAPVYKEYHLYFTNFVPDTNLKALAEADQFELVRQVKEFYGDFYALDEVSSLHQLGGTRVIRDYFTAIYQEIAALRRRKNLGHQTRKS